MKEFTEQEFNAILHDLVKWGLMNEQLLEDGERGFTVTRKGVRYGIILESAVNEDAFIRADEDDDLK